MAFSPPAAAEVWAHPLTRTRTRARTRTRTLAPTLTPTSARSPPAPDPDQVWARLGRAKQDGLTLFMAVPTNYALLLREAEKLGTDHELIRAGAEGAQSLRLMVSGSMALPTPVLERWRALTGHTLLERYGMTELGMALSNQLHERVLGAVGRPLPGVEVKSRDAQPQPQP